MKILYCTPQLYGAGGLERVLSIKMNALAARGHDILVVTTDQKGRDPFFALSPNIQLIDLALNYKDDFANPIWKRLTLLYQKRKKHKHALSRVIASYLPDVIVSTFHEEVSFLPDIAARIPLIVERHTSKDDIMLEHKSHRLSPRWLLHKLYCYNDERYAARFDRLVLLTQEDRKKWPLHNVEVIPNPLSFSSNVKAPLGGKIALTIGRYTEQKDLATLIDIWSLVDRQQRLGWQLHIVGDGHLKERLQEHIVSLGLDGEVRLLPPRSHVEELYREADVFLLSSRFEGLPMVLLEAIHMGLPVISFACPSGPRDIIEGTGAGYLLPPGDKVGFAKQLTRLMSDLGLRKKMGQNGIERAKQYNVDHIISLWEKLFLSICETK